MSMLETRSLTKIYKPKRGVPVKALDNVSLKFPDTGMVFLTGKSGSGKSTLLNLLGGLDKYNSGEILIKNTSSKKFAQRHFDSYRNTYVGFIFQEYNILEEFSVGANIALALQLQGKKATDEAINKILKEVDMEGYGSRRPNELSGGQKQRVAIARALVKEPKIIMADEPTGALDSVTGRQVLEMLKKLSRTRLVIVVSHDLDFAQTYADRIIELSDGRVISDLSQTGADLTQAAQALSFEGSKIMVPENFHLTEEDRQAICTFIQELPKGSSLSFETVSPKKGRFETTDTAAITAKDPSPFKLIKSRLPLRWAFKLGSGGLKYKKFRLVMTIILSVFAFTMFGLADTLASYDHVENATVSILDTGVRYAAVRKTYEPVEYDADYLNWYQRPFTAEDIEAFSHETGLDFSPVYFGNISVEQHMDSMDITDISSALIPAYFTGAIEVSEDLLDEFGYELTDGRLPNGNTRELAVSEAFCRNFMNRGYIGYEYITYPADEWGDGYTELEAQDEERISGPEDMLGKPLLISETPYTIVGIIDTDYDWELHDYLLDELKDLPVFSMNYGDIPADLLAAYNRLSCNLQYDMTCFAMVGEGHLNDLVEARISGSQSSMSMNAELSNGMYIYLDFNSLSGADEAQNIYWLDSSQTVLRENEVLIDFSALLQMAWSPQTGTESYFVFDKDTLAQQEFDAYVFSYTGYGRDETVKVAGLINVPAGADLDTQWPSSADDMLELYHAAGWEMMSADEILWTSRQVCLSDDLYDSFSGKDTATLLLAPMPQDEEAVRKLVKHCYDNGTIYTYALSNPINNELDPINTVLTVLTSVFVYVGLAFALFSALLLANFITISISNKKQEIGVLRAIGSRSNDVFRIFLAESFIIAMINFGISTIGVFALCGFGNSYISTNLALQSTLLNCGLRQVLLLLVISIGVAFIASFLPVKRIASKRPIDAIRNR